MAAFRRDLLRAAPREPDYYHRLYRADREAFLRAQETAWQSKWPEPYISLAQALAANEPLSAKTARRLARNLIRVSRYAEAIELLRGLGQDPVAVLDLARAELRQGRLDAAAAAAARAQALDPLTTDDAREIEASITQLRSAEEAAAATGDWTSYRALFDLWIGLDAPEPAYRVMMAAMLAGAWFRPEEEYDFFEALDLVLSLHPPPSAQDLFQAMEPMPYFRRRMTMLQAAHRWIDAAATGPGEPGAAEIKATGPLIGGSAAIALGVTGHRRAAIETLGALTLAHPKQRYLRFPLARFVAQDVLASHPLTYGPAGPRKIFDVFIFNNELRLLELKLHEMADWVDAFVLVEARQTFTGAPKPLVFEQNRERFAAFASKIIHVVVDEFPPHIRHPWAREFYQRDMGVRGLDGRCQEDDLVIISDTDEVVSKAAVLGFEGEYAKLGMEKLRYFINYRQALGPDELKLASCLVRAKYIRTIGLAYARGSLFAHKKVRRITNAGWHFTSVADAPGIAHKLNNTAHQEFAGATLDGVRALLAEIRSGRLEPGWERVELDEKFPAYVRQNRGEFEDVLL